MQQPKSYTATLLLSFFLGGLGIHRFYTGYIGIGILQLLTGGGCGIWTLIDFVSICFNNYKDANDQDLGGYNATLGKTFFFIWIALIVFGIIIYASAFSAALRG